MKLDYTSLKKAIESLEKAAVRAEGARSDEELRDAVIQRFEYTYELCSKMIKRQLEQEVASPSLIDNLSFKDLLREAAEKGMMQNIERWMEYRSQRNITAHIYDKVKAQSVYATALLFLKDAKRLCSDLERR